MTLVVIESNDHKTCNCKGVTNKRVKSTQEIFTYYGQIFSV